MIIVKGFAVIPSLASNVANTVAAAGELSNKTRSYSKDIKIYNSSTIGDEVSLYAFSIKDGAIDATIPSTLGQQANALLNYIYTNMKSRGGTQIQPQVLVDLLISEYGTQYSGIEVGNFVVVGGFFLPSYVRFLSSDGTNIDFKVWFSNSLFETGYDVFSITIIPPVLPNAIINLKTTNAAQVTSALNAFKAEDLAVRLRSLTDVAPYTELLVEPIEWVNGNNVNERIPTKWYIVIYGAGYSIEDIKDRVKDILATASSNIDEWRTIFPSLFGGSIFKLTPHWDKLSIINASVESSMYSPIMAPNDVINYAMRIEIAGNLAHVSNNVEGIPIPYKGLVLSAVGNADNANGYTKLSQMYPDYISISSTSPDIDRLPQRTQAFLRIVVDLAIAAEVLTTNSQLPQGIGRTTSGGLLYATATLDGVVFMMVGRSSLLAGTP